MILLKKIHKKFTTILASVFLLAATNSCGLWDPADARKVSPNADERVKKNLEEGKGFRLSTKLKGIGKGGGDFEFASSNSLWRASLDIIDFMPLSTANYNGGLIVTDWYSEGSNTNESIKIQVRFLTNEVRSDALDIKIFYKNCSKIENCKVSEQGGILVAELTKKILSKAAIYLKQRKDKDYKPYVGKVRPSSD